MNVICFKIGQFVDNSLCVSSQKDRKRTIAMIFYFVFVVWGMLSLLLLLLDNDFIVANLKFFVAFCWSKLNMKKKISYRIAHLNVCLIEMVFVWYCLNECNLEIKSDNGMGYKFV